MRTREQILGELSALGEEIRRHADALERLYARRLAVFQEARALDPPILQREIAVAAGVKEIAVTAALRKAERAAS